VVRDTAVSRLHVEIRREGEGWIAADRGSRNGTLLNGTPLVEPAPVVPGDEITLGKTVLVFDRPVPGAILVGAELPPAAYLAALPGTVAGSGEPVLVGRSGAIRSAQAAIEEIAPSDEAVLITGEVGTGKELAARVIHHRSPRRDGPLIVVNCPALPGDLLERELFGEGGEEAAAGGTLLLVEIGLMDAALQSRLHRLLEEGSGPDARILATTSHDLEAEVAADSFQQDLRDHLERVTLWLPPLRERREDLPFLLRHFGSRPGHSAKMSPEAMDLLLRYDFPGNVEELENLLGRARLLTQGPVIKPEDLPEEVRAGDRRRRDATTRGFMLEDGPPEE